MDEIKRKGCIVIKNVVDDAEAAEWREDLQAYVKANPVDGQSLLTIVEKSGGF